MIRELTVAIGAFIALGLAVAVDEQIISARDALNAGLLLVSFVLVAYGAVFLTGLRANRR